MLFSKIYKKKDLYVWINWHKIIQISNLSHLYIIMLHIQKEEFIECKTLSTPSKKL